jgi:YbbR domain-containing protein
VASLFRGITDNWKLKMLAFALAVLLWVVVSAEQVTSSWVTVPLEVQLTDPDFRLTTTELPHEVQVRFTGPGRDLLDLALRRPPLRLTISDVKGPIENRTLDPRSVQVPTQLSVNAVEVRPSFVQLEFSQLSTVMLPVNVRVANRLGDEWAIVDSLRAEPARIRVSGPLEQVRALTSLPTRTVALTSGDTLFSRAVQIDTTGLSGLNIGTRTVQVEGRIDRLVERTITGKEVDVGPGIRIAPEEVNVTLRGPARVVGAVNAELFRIAISIAGIPTRIPDGGFAVPLRVDGLRPGIEATLSPSSVLILPNEPVDSIALPGEPVAEPVEEVQADQ